MMPSWCRQVNWGNCGIPWVNCAFLCERRLERTVLRPALLPVKTAQFTQFFIRQVWRHTVKSLSLTQFLTMYRALQECWELCSCFPVGLRHRGVVEKAVLRTELLPISYLVATEALSLAIKRPERGVDHSHLLPRLSMCGTLPLPFLYMPPSCR